MQTDLDEVESKRAFRAFSDDTSKSSEQTPNPDKIT